MQSIYLDLVMQKHILKIELCVVST